MKEKKFTRKEQLLEAALDEFASKDYDSASINTIIKSAHISKGVFYYHFENKEALYLYLLKTGSDAKWEYIKKESQTASTTFEQMDLFDKFLYQAKLGAGFALLYPKYYALSQKFVQEKKNSIYQTAIEYLGINNSDLITSMIQESIAKKELKLEFGETFLIKLISHLLLAFDQIFYDDNTVDMDNILSNLEDYVTFMKYGLKA